MAQILTVKKREGHIANFDSSKIQQAIYKALLDVNTPDALALSGALTDIAISKITYDTSIEAIQDIVEDTLLEQKLVEAAKHYILYRDEKRKIREEKKRILQKHTLDEVDKSFSLNQLRVLAERYLLRDVLGGAIIETPKEMFRRVATLIGLSDLLHDTVVFDKKGESESDFGQAWPPQPYQTYSHMLKDRHINEHHYDRFCNLYKELYQQDQMKLNFKDLMENHFVKLFDNIYEKKIQEYYNLMVSCTFIPNTPTLMNAGTSNGGLSACFLENQIIYTKEGIKKISDIKVGDEVITHSGSTKRVTEVFKRAAPKYYKVDIQNLIKPTLEVTEEHPILSISKEQSNNIESIPKWTPVKDLKAGDYVVISFDREIKDVKEIDIFTEIFATETDRTYIEIDNMIYVQNKDRHHIRKSLVNRQIKPIKSIITVDTDLMKLLGYYMADGNSDNDMVRYTYGWEDIELANETISLMEKIFGVSAVIEYQERNDGKQGKWITLRFHSKLLARVFNKWIGTGFDTKRIPKWIMTLPPHKQIEFIKAIILCDGTYHNKTGKRLSLSNASTIYDIYNMLLRCRIVGTIRKSAIPKLTTVQPYDISISQSQTVMMMSPSFTEVLSLEYDTEQKPINGRIMLRINSIEEVQEEKDVYNIEVDDDHSYLANFVSVHNCFVLDAVDEVDSYIRETVGDAASIFRAAGGVGINFSKFRPEGASANGVPNAASGPCSFIQMINTLTDVIKAGGKRRGANMGVLDLNHPNVEQFITMKSTPGVLENFNVSVGVWDEYWGALTSGKTEFELSHPTHPEKNKVINPQHLWDLIALSAWKSAEPGVLFFDNVNKVNHMKEEIGLLNVVNPCGEQFLDYNNSCTLGSINVAKFVDPETKEFGWPEFVDTVRLTTRFLDNVLDMNKYPTEKIAKTSKSLRRIGLGVMGVADAMFMMNIPYNSKEGFNFMASICEIMTSGSISESMIIAKERGPYPLYNYSNHGVDIKKKRTSSTLNIDFIDQQHIYQYGVRNAWNTTVAPTGTISMIAGCSSGIEPEFALGFEKKVTIGSFYYSNKYLTEALKKEGLYSDALLKKIADNGGSIQSIEEIPESIKKVFVTAMDIHWADHVMAQAACQQCIDNSISKTVNMANDVLVDDIKNAYLLAHELGCKGLSVYRDGSRAAQVLHTNSEKTGKQLKPSTYVLDYIQEHIKNEYVLEKLGGLLDNKKTFTTLSGDLSVTINGDGYFGNQQIHILEGDISVCPSCHSQLMFKEGCKSCNCGWSACSVS